MPGVVTHLLIVLPALFLIKGRLLLLLLSSCFAILCRADFYASSNHLLKLPLISCLFFLLSLGEELALLLELLDSLLLLLLLQRLELFSLLGFLGLQPFFLLDPGLLLSFQAFVLLCAPPKFLLLPPDGLKMRRELLLLSTVGSRRRGRGRGSRRSRVLALRSGLCWLCSLGGTAGGLLLSSLVSKD